MIKQPDDRIRREDLGVFSLNGKRFVINNRRGVPRNACIEKGPGGFLRCWASHVALTDEAAAFVRRHSDFNEERNHFTWHPKFYLRMDKSRQVERG